jgi:hypothetical protein
MVKNATLKIYPVGRTVWPTPAKNSSTPICWIS